MKISFRSDPPFPSTLLSDDSLGASGITEHQSPYVDNKEVRCLVEGENRLWADVNPGSGNVMYLECLVGQDPSKILKKLSEISGSEFYAEFQPEFSGSETMEEQDIYREITADSHRKEIYQYLLRHALGLPDRYEELSYYKAEIARHLIAKEPSLAFDRDRLLNRVNWECQKAQNNGDLPPI